MKNMNKTDKQYTTDLLLQKGLIISLLMSFSAPVLATDSFQHKMLFTPSQGMLSAEQRGRVMIYNGLASRDVDKAMDEQYDRIENMMFVQMTYLQNGDEVIDDEDDCD